MRRFVVACALSALLARDLAAQATRLWRPEERAVIGAFNVVTAVAATSRRLYAAGPGGLAVYDLQFHAWQVPVSAADGLPRGQIVAALADPADESLWLGTLTGLVHYRPEIRQFEIIAATFGAVDGLVFDKADPFRGIYYHDASGWRFLPRGGIIGQPANVLPAQRIAPIGVQQALARAPAADAFRPLTLNDPRLRNFHYTCAALVPTTGEIFFGTDGLGVIHFDPAITRFERLPFGLLEQGAGAVIPVPGGVWVGTDARALRPGFTRVSDDLRDYQFEEGPLAESFAFHGVRAMLWRGRALWAATDAGLWTVEPGGRINRRDTGLPDDNLFALAQGSRGVWVGTAAGLALVPDTGAARATLGIREPVLSLSAASDSLWVGAAGGLWFTWAGDSGAYQPANVTDAGAAAPPPRELTEPIVAITRSADTVVVATVDQIVWRAPGKPWVVEHVISPSIGPLFALVGDTAGVWIGGGRGLAHFRFKPRDYQMYYAPGDVPGAVHGLAVSGDYLWVATEHGLVRFLKRALVP